MAFLINVAKALNIININCPTLRSGQLNTRQLPGFCHRHPFG